jgi:hypothetical protein
MKDKRCRVCGAYSNKLHHPSCPIGISDDTFIEEEESEEMFVVNEDMLQYISHAIAIAGAQYTEYMNGKNEDKILTERVQQFQQDYLELSDFGEGLYNAGLILTVEDMIYLMKYPDKYSQYYLIWLELSRPINEKDETFELFVKEIWERNQVGKQTKNTGD